VRQIILGIVVLIALIVLAMSLALSAAETRDERDVLVALGAPPRTMRSVAAWKAGLLSFTGAALAVPTGFIPVAFVYIAAARPGETARLAFPWTTVLELVFVAPLIAALIAGIGSAVAQKVRPTQMSTFATD
jgi:putative ABC transport system permease protein